MRAGIIGGSIAGCATAALLHRAGHDVTVFERLKAARSSMRFQDRRLADLEARLAAPSART